MNLLCKAEVPNHRKQLPSCGLKGQREELVLSKGGGMGGLPGRC